MAILNVFDILNKVYGPRGIPFPAKPLQGEGHAIAGKFGPPLLGEGSALATGFEYEAKEIDERARHSNSLIRRYDDRVLGRYTFLPVQIDGYYLPNPLVIINGEKLIVETDLVDVGTVFEKVFMRPYDITIICTLIGEDGNWPEQQLSEIAKIWEEGDLVTLKCASTDIYLQPSDNFIFTKIAQLDSQGAENVEVLQLDGRSNRYFELEIA